MNIRLGILGGGQLGRMSAQAATELGIETIIYTDSKNGPASQVVSKTYVGDYTDVEKLTAFAQDVDVISYEFENIPVETIKLLTKLKPVHPDEILLETSQHRVVEKSFLNDIGIPTAKWCAVKSIEDIKEALEEWGTTSCILKTCRFGYDGKGQARYSVGDAFPDFGTDDLIAEEIVDFDFEVSVIVARDVDGKCVFYGPLHNEHK
ncbi:MAG: ATP-grasp domain-containing protein, partial [Alphaproteobacteria bacterium]|nr:ATP-grasp domain-containing protein [Alphaproteobacteria bacterium]